MIRHDNNEATIIPIILRHCYWLSAPFAKLHVLPHKDKPISTYKDKDEAWLEVVKAIQKIVEREKGSPVSPIEPPKPVINVAMIQQLIGKARLKDALDLLEKDAPEHVIKVVLTLKSRLSTLERSNMLGLLSASEESIERNKIVHAVLGCVSKYEGDSLLQSESPSKITIKPLIFTI